MYKGVEWERVAGQEGLRKQKGKKNYYYQTKELNNYKNKGKQENIILLEKSYLKGADKGNLNFKFI